MYFTVCCHPHIPTTIHHFHSRFPLLLFPVPAVLTHMSLIWCLHAPVWSRALTQASVTGPSKSLDFGCVNSMHSEHTVYYHSAPPSFFLSVCSSAESSMFSFTGRHRWASVQSRFTLLLRQNIQRHNAFPISCDGKDFLQTPEICHSHRGWIIPVPLPMSSLQLFPCRWVFPRGYSAPIHAYSPEPKRDLITASRELTDSA